MSDSVNTICCSIQFAHLESPLGILLCACFREEFVNDYLLMIICLDRSTLFYISYGHGYIKVCDYTNGKILGQLMLVKQSKTTNLNDPRCKSYYPLTWMNANTLLTGNIE